MTRKEQISKSESNLIRGLLALMILIGSASTHVQNLGLERQLQDDKRTYAALDAAPSKLVAKL